MAASNLISDRLLERLVDAFVDLVETVRIGLSSAAELPCKRRWERKALPILTNDLSELMQEIDQYRSASSVALERRVSQLRFLAREMDGYSLECFAEEVASRLQQSRNLVILFAWQIYDAMAHAR